MKRIDEWVRENLDPTEQKIIVRDGLEVVGVTWNESFKSSNVVDLYSEHAFYIWMMLDDKAETLGKRPLQILDDYGMRSDSWPCSPEGFAEVALFWAIEEQCRQNCPDWK
jgi:hypothetical protein